MDFANTNKSLTRGKPKEYETKLFEVKAQNVIRYIKDLIIKWDGWEPIAKNEFLFHPYKFEQPKDTRIEFMVIESRMAQEGEAQFPGKTRMTKVLTAVAFEVWQLQEDTVQLKMIFFDVGLPIDETWEKITAAFSKQDEGFTSTSKEKRQTKKPRKIKQKGCLPPTYGPARKWVIVWDAIKPKIDIEPSLENNFVQLKYYLQDQSIDYFEPETLRKIIACGKSNGIPTLDEFESNYTK